MISVREQASKQSDGKLIRHCNKTRPEHVQSTLLVCVYVRVGNDLISLKSRRMNLDVYIKWKKDARVVDDNDDDFR